MKSAIQDLVLISQYAAQHPKFIQGGGGNCSVKFSDQMAVKASGYWLEDVTEENGYVIVDMKTHEPVSPGNLKASIEIDLHYLLGTYTMHTHPIPVTALICAKQGKKAFLELFPGPPCQWIDYAQPGKLLAEQIQAVISKAPASNQENLALFLANHGLVISAPTKEGCIELHEKIIEKLNLFFGEVPHSESQAPKNRYLTPDHIVYTNPPRKKLSGKNEAAYKETGFLVQEALSRILHKGWEPAWLPDPAVRKILDMQEEKYRQNLWKASP